MHACANEYMYVCMCVYMPFTMHACLCVNEHMQMLDVKAYDKPLQAYSHAFIATHHHTSAGARTNTGMYAFAFVCACARADVDWDYASRKTCCGLHLVANGSGHFAVDLENMRGGRRLLRRAAGTVSCYRLRSRPACQSTGQDNLPCQISHSHSNRSSEFVRGRPKHRASPKGG